MGRDMVVAGGKGMMTGLRKEKQSDDKPKGGTTTCYVGTIGRKFVLQGKRELIWLIKKKEETSGIRRGMEEIVISIG